MPPAVLPDVLNPDGRTVIERIARGVDALAEHKIAGRDLLGSQGHLTDPKQLVAYL